MQWVGSTLHSVCSHSAVGNLCSVLLCVELDIDWIFFFLCLSSITVLAGYILKQILHTEFIPLRSFCTRDVQTECMHDLVVIGGISLICSFGFHSQQFFRWCKLLFYHKVIFSKISF